MGLNSNLTIIKGVPVKTKIKQNDIEVNENIKEFLETLFSLKPDETLIQSWELNGKKTTSFKHLKQAINYVAQHDRDIYVSIGLTDRDYGPNRRCPSDKISGIVGFYADIDIKGLGHKKQNLPETIEQAESFVKGYGFDPSIIVHSGHGLQAWWLFREPWIFDSPEERKLAAEYSQRVTETLRQRAKKHGWGVDGVHDLARVLRILVL